MNGSTGGSAFGSAMQGIAGNFFRLNGFHLSLWVRSGISHCASGSPTGQIYM